MTGPITVRNAVDTWVDQNRPAKVIKQSARFVLRDSPGDNRRGFMYFTLPFPLKAKIISARLYLYNVDPITSSTTITARRVNKKWALGRITWNNASDIAVVGTAGSLTRANAPKGSLWNIDVTAMMQEVANGAAWYGIRLLTSNAANQKWYASETTAARFRPALVVTWTTAPEEPDSLQPSNELAVSVAKPILTYDFSDPNGEGDLNAQQIQFAATEAALLANTPSWDSGTVQTEIPQFDTSTSTWPGLAVGEIVWWRVRAQDVAGQWSVWSDPVEFSRQDKGALVIDDPAGTIWEGSPRVAWTFTGQVQQAYRVFLARADLPTVRLWDSGRVTSEDTEVSIPFGEILDANAEYVVTVQVWDPHTRIATPGDPTYVEQSVVCSIGYDGLVDDVTELTMASDPLMPMAKLFWNDATPPDAYQIQRSLDEGATWTYIGEEDSPEEISIGGTSYEWIDESSPSYKEVWWRVLRVVGGHQSVGATTTGEVRRLAPFLFRSKGSDPVVFLNPNRSMGFGDVHGIHDTNGGISILVTQRLGKRRGSLAGRLVGGVIQGLTADDLLTNFLSMRENVGEILYLGIANTTIRVNAYNFAYDIVTDGEGVTYSASFDWIEV